jgi:carboxymethylenebutenolidase
MINVTSKNGIKISYYLVDTIKNSAPAIIIINENFEINHWIKITTDDFAERGYVAITTDLAHNMKSRLATQPITKAHLIKKLGAEEYTDYEAAIVDLALIITEVKALSNCNGKVAVVGFSSGATLAYLSAARLHVDAVIGYYGAGILEYLNEGKNINCPLLLHMSAHDNRLKPNSLNKIQAALIGKGNISIYTYIAGHSFANSHDPKSYLPDAASLAHGRTIKTLERLDN